MAQVRELMNMTDWHQALESSSDRPVLLLKHSTRCPISAAAYDEFLKYAFRNEELPVELALVLVVERRPVSNAVAEALTVRHESPQAILISEGRAVWNASHGRITEAALSEQVSKH